MHVVENINQFYVNFEILVLPTLNAWVKRFEFLEFCFLNS